MPLISSGGRAPLALHPAEGNATLKVKQNGQIKALSCLFYVATSRAGQQVHIVWNETTVEIFTQHGEHIIDYPRPETTGMYYGPRSARQGTPMKDAGQNRSAAVTGAAQRTVSKGGYVGVLASKFYAGYKRHGEQVTITWDATNVTITDTAGTPIASYDKPTQRRGWHGHHRDTAVHEVMRHTYVHDVLRHICARSPETSHFRPDRVNPMNGVSGGCHYEVSAAGNRSLKVIAKALSAGFHRMVHRARPVPVGSSDRVTR